MPRKSRETNSAKRRRNWISRFFLSTGPRCFFFNINSFFFEKYKKKRWAIKNERWIRRSHRLETAGTTTTATASKNTTNNNETHTKKIKINSKWGQKRKRNTIEREISKSNEGALTGATQYNWIIPPSLRRRRRRRRRRKKTKRKKVRKEKNEINGPVIRAMAPAAATSRHLLMLFKCAACLIIVCTGSCFTIECWWVVGLRGSTSVSVSEVIFSVFQPFSLALSLSLSLSLSHPRSQPRWRIIAGRPLIGYRFLIDPIAAFGVFRCVSRRNTRGRSLSYGVEFRLFLFFFSFFFFFFWEIVPSLDKFRQKPSGARRKKISDKTSHRTAIEIHQEIDCRLSNRHESLDQSNPRASFCRVTLLLTGFYRVLLSFTEFYFVLPSFTGFYWVLLGFTGFYWVSLRFYCLG